ncbi:DUF167 domain-containing protein [Candidatus Pacearchaeota archaeon]|nr:DUF167 domain-containing protein [Candidatus Pacearchaeota archaeon]
MMIKVKVKPSSGKQSIEKKGGFYLINVKSKPENNKANIEVIKLLERYFKKPVKIKSGLTSRNKVIEIID